MLSSARAADRHLVSPRHRHDPPNHPSGTPTLGLVKVSRLDDPLSEAQRRASLLGCSVVEENASAHPEPADGLVEKGDALAPLDEVDDVAAAVAGRRRTATPCQG